MAILKELVQAISREAGENLSPLGFKKRGGQVFTTEPVNGFLGWIGLNHGTRPLGVVEINPVVGIRCQEIEFLLSEIMEEKPHLYIPPTLSISLGYLMPDAYYQAWLFDEITAISEGVRGIIEAFAKYGLPFIDSALSIEKIENLLVSGKFGVPEQNVYRVPLALYLEGKTEIARDVVQKHLVSLANRTDLAADRYRKFHEKLTGLLRNER